MDASITCKMGETVECSLTAFKLGFNPFIALGLSILIVIIGYGFYRLLKIFLDVYEEDIKAELGVE